jgi:amino acid transporter
MKSKPKKLGLFMLIALVCGNMIGSGVFLLPSSLAALGSISLWSWAVTGFGALILALLFAKMSVLVPYSGEPFAYAYAHFFLKYDLEEFESAVISFIE